jgi:hypothetical protein
MDELPCTATTLNGLFDESSSYKWRESRLQPAILFEFRVPHYDARWKSGRQLVIICEQPKLASRSVSKGTILVTSL